MKKNINIILAKTLFNISIAIATGGLLISCGVNGDSRSHPRQSLFAGNQYAERYPLGQDRAGSPASEVKEGIDINQDSLGAIQKVLEITKDSDIFEEDLSKQNNSSPISFRELIEYLPQSPRGWTAEKPKGQTSSFGDYSVSQVKQKYFQKDKTMTVSIFDWAFNSTLYMPFLLSTEFSQESTEGYSKGIKIDDIPGRENYNYHSRDGGLNLLINRRFFVQISGENIEESELREWWEILDRKSLSQLK